MKLKKKLIIIISMLTLLLLSTGIGVYAYLQFTKNQAVTASTNINNDNVIEVASFDELFTNSKATAYNDKNVISNVSTRTILKLTSNIELLDNLEITSDVHLNLNGKTLNLNDKELTFRHGYAGCFSIYGGVVSTGDTGTGKITVDLPNASFISSSITYNHSGTTLAESDCVNVLNIDSKYTAYNALYYVANSIGSDLNKKIEKADYTAVNDANYTIDQDKFITTKYNCVYNSNANDVCSFVYKDLDLPMHYLSTDISITYSSNKKNVISNFGKVTLPTQEEDVTLTASINHTSWEDPITCDFKLHVVNLENQTVKNNVAKQLILDYLHDYYKNESLQVSSTVTFDSYYEFTNSVELPLLAFDDNITYSYSFTNLNGENVDTTSFVDVNNRVFVMQSNDDCNHLIIRLNNNTNITLDMFSAYVSDYETIARLILNKLYGGSIIYDSTESSKILYKVSDLRTMLDEKTYQFVTAYNITNLTYSLKDGTDVKTRYYNYSSQNYELTVKDGQIPPAKSSYITATFTFGSGADAVTTNVDMYVNYLAESGDTVSGFLPYYNLYDPMVVEDLTSYFDMPFSYSTGAPYVCYDFAQVFTKKRTTEYTENFNYYDYELGIPNSLQISLWYNGAQRLTFTNTSETLTTQLDSYLTTNNITLKQIAEYDDAKYRFRIVPQNATDNIPMLLIYNYKFNPANNWSRYEYTIEGNKYVTELTSSRFIVSGGLFYNATSTASNAVQDKYFFTWIYNNFNPEGNTIATSNVDENSFIPKNWLSLDVALDKTIDSSLANVTNYAGIGNLTHITKVNLTGITLSTSVLLSIASMTSVTSLNISNCGVSDITNICTMDSVKVLDISNNSIKDFNGLVNMDGLEEVYLYNNNSTTNNPIVGSLGITNLQAYNDLLRDGIAVFNQISDGIPVLYADSDDYNDYVKIKSIIYQNKLATGKSIEDLYKDFKNINANGFSLYNTGGSFTWGYQTSDANGNTYDATTATYFYCNYKFKNNNNTLTVKFYVDRYE